MNDRTQKIYAWLVCGGIAAVMPRMPQKWYNMQQIDMSGNLPMRRRAGNAKVRYSAAYPTGAERIAKGTPLP